jgi:ribosomal protein S18 acetylase RimI-like enzyme
MFFAASGGWDVRSRFGEVTMIEVTRLKPKDAELAQRAINALKPSRERDHKNVTADYMQNFLEEDKNILILALEDHSPVGFALAYLLDRVDRNRAMILFYEIIVSDNHRRHGLGTKMVNELKRIGQDLNVMKIWVLTDQSNTAAVGLYVSTGARQAGDDDVVFVYGANSFG